MKLAVIDCGTNTFNLLIVEVISRTAYRKIYHTRVPVKLGEISVNHNHISEIPFNRGLDALASFSERIKAEGISNVLAFATSAIRDGDNGPLFVETARERFGLHIQVIDGEREAELIYSGIRGAVKLNQSISLIMDIGGGSTEFILANASGILWKHSFNIGAARLLNKFAPSDVLTVREAAAITHYLSEELSLLKKATTQWPPVELIGSSGAFESFIEMIHGEMDGPPFDGETTEYSLPIASYTALSRKVKNSSLEQRKNFKGLIPMRVDMIVICCLMVDFVLHEFNLKQLRISTYSLKEGAMLDFIEKNYK